MYLSACCVCIRLIISLGPRFTSVPSMRHNIFTTRWLVFTRGGGGSARWSLVSSACWYKGKKLLIWGHGDIIQPPGRGEGGGGGVDGWRHVWGGAIALGVGARSLLDSKASTLHTPFPDPVLFNKECLQLSQLCLRNRNFKCYKSLF